MIPLKDRIGHPIPDDEVLFDPNPEASCSPAMREWLAALCRKAADQDASDDRAG